MNFETTSLLRRVRAGDAGAIEELFQILYGELRDRAGAMMRRERSGHTLQATALVHEAFFKLVGREGADWKDRNHFLAIACRSMRQVLVDHARRRNARGGERTRVPMENAVGQAARRIAVDLLELDDALQGLHAADERAARVAEMRVFGELSHEEIADVLGVSSKTVKRDWKAAQGYLHLALRPPESGGKK